MVSLLPKRKTEKRPVFSLHFFEENVVVSFAGGILILAALLYGGMAWYRSRLAHDMKRMQAEAANLEAERNLDLENRVRDFAGRISSIRGILSTHIYSSKIFPFIESVAHPKVQFTDFSFSVADGGITLNAATQDYITLGQQVSALEQNPNVRNVKVGDVKLSKSGQVLFSVSFEVDTSLYQ